MLMVFIFFFFALLGRSLRKHLFFWVKFMIGFCKIAKPPVYGGRVDAIFLKANFCSERILI